MSNGFGDRNDRDRHRGERNQIKPNYFLPKPVKVGDEIDVTIEATASRGDGIAKKDGFVIFIKDAKKGDRVRVKITDVRTRFAIGEVIGEASSAEPEEGGAEEDVPEEESEEESETEASEE